MKGKKYIFNRSLAMILAIVMIVLSAGGQLISASNSEKNVEIENETSLQDNTEVVDESVSQEETTIEEEGGAEKQPLQEGTIVHEGVENEIAWSIDSNGHLVLQGTGDYNSKPWLNHMDMIKTAEVNITDITNLSGLFAHCISLTSVDLSNLDTSKVTNMQEMFAYCYMLSELDLSNFNTSNVTDMSGMFQLCRSLSAIDVSNFDTSNVTHMGAMFNQCENVEILDVSGFNTSKVEQMSSMFDNCHNVKELDLKNFDVSHVRTMERLFCGCHSIEKIDLSEWDFSNVQNISRMFWNCKQLAGINLSNANLTSLTSADELFDGCNNLKSIQTPLNLSVEVNLPTDEDITKAWIDEDKNSYTHLPVNRSSSISLSYEEIETEIDPGWVYYGKDNQLIWSIDKNGHFVLEGTGDYSSRAWSEYASEIKTAEVNVTGITNLRDLFSGCINMTSVNLIGLETKNVTNMTNMFYECSALKMLDVSSFCTENVIYMADMFDGCSSIEKLDLSNFDTRKVLSMGSMFSRCGNLKELDLSGFNTENVYDVWCMFQNCRSLITLDLSSFDLRGITDEYGVLGMLGISRGNCLSTIYTPKNLSWEVTLPSTEEGEVWKDKEGNIYTTLPINQSESIELNKAVEEEIPGEEPGENPEENPEGGNPGKPEEKPDIEVNPDWVYYGKDNQLIWSIDKNGHFVLEGTGNYGSRGWSEYASEIKTAEIKVTGITSLQSLFENCTNLKSIEWNNLDTSKVTIFNNLFKYCTSLENIDVSQFDVSDGKDYSGMFYGCTALKSIDLSKQIFNPTGAAGNVLGFITCTSLEMIKTPAYLPWWEELVQHEGKVWDCDGHGYDRIPSGMTESITLVLKEPHSNRADITWSIDANGHLLVEGSGEILGENGIAEMIPWGGNEAIKTATVRLDNITNLSGLFRGCSNLKTVDLSGLDTSKVTNMSNMFYQCDSLTNLDLSNFDTSNVTNMSNMFNSCINLESVNIDRFDTSNVTDMQSMFYECRKIKEINVSHFNTNKVTNMTHMFSCCNELNMLDLSSIDMKNVVFAENMIWDSSMLETIKAPKNLTLLVDLNQVEGYKWMGSDGYTYVSLPEKKAESISLTRVKGEVQSSEIVYNGTSGTLKWTISADGCFTLSGSGDYELHQDSSGYYVTDWYKYRSKIKNAVINVNNITNLSYLFSNCYYLQTVDFTGLDTSKVTDMSHMFEYCFALLAVDFSNFDTRNVTDMSYMFRKNNSEWHSAAGYMTELDMSNFDTSKVTDMSYMFYENGGLYKIYVESFDTSNVTDMSYMFGGCHNLNTVNISSFDTSSVTNMEGMFSDAGTMKTWDVSGFDTSNVTNMAYMFYWGSSLENLDVSHFDTSKVTNMYRMFRHCPMLKELDVSGFDTRNVVNMSEMFYDCILLESLNLGGFDCSKVTSATNMLGNLPELIEINAPLNLKVSVFLPTLVAGKTWEDDSKNVYTELPVNQDRSKWLRIITDVQVIYSGTTGNLKWTIDNNGLFTLSGSGNYEIGEEGTPWREYASEIRTAEINITDCTNLSCLFEQCYKLRTVNFNNIDTSKVTTTKAMFAGCKNLSAVDLTSFDTKNVVDMSFMFDNCSSLNSLDVTNFDTSRVVDMCGMFEYCSNLKNLDVSGFDTSSATNIAQMFMECRSLKSIDISNFSTEQVTDMRGLFDNCSGLTTLDVSNLDTRNTTNMAAMFYKCSGLTSLDVSTLNTKNVEDMSLMFGRCSSLNNLDLSTFDTRKAIQMDNMFYNCSNLESLNISGFDMSAVTDALGFLEKSDSLMTIYTPYNLDFEIMLPEDDNLEWIDAERKVHTKLPIDTKRSVLLKRWGDLYSGKSNNVSWSIDGSYNLTVWGTGDYELVDGIAPWGEYASKIVSADVSVDGITSLKNLLTGCTNLTKVDLSKLDTSKVTDMSGMFQGCKRLKKIDLNSLHTENVITMDYMFQGCNSINSLELDLFELDKLESANGMLDECKALSSILTPLNLEIKIYLQTQDDEIWMDEEEESHLYLPLNSENSILLQKESREDIAVYSGKSGDIEWLITQHGKLIVRGKGDYEVEKGEKDAWLVPWSNYAKHIVSAEIAASGMTHWDYMFNGCENLEVIYLNKIDASEIQTAHKIFQGCDALKTIYTPCDLECNIMLPKVDFYVWSDEEESLHQRLPQYEKISHCLSLKEDQKVVIKEKSGDLTWGITEDGEFILSGKGDYEVRNVEEGSEVSPFALLRRSIRTANKVPWAVYADEIKTATIHVEGITSLEHLFENCTNLQSVDMNGLDTSQVRSMNALFMNCDSLTTLDLRAFDTSNVENMSNMFNGCSNLQVLHLNSFDMGNVTNTENFLNNCDSLEKLGMPKNVAVETELPNAGIKVWVDMEENECTYLPMNMEENIVISKETAKDTYIAEGTSGNINWKISNEGHFTLTGNGDYDVKNTGWQTYAPYITSVEIAVKNITNMNGLFYGFTAMKRLDLSGLDTTELTAYEDIWNGCDALEVIVTPKSLNKNIALNSKENCEWVDSKGNVYEELPCAMSESIIIQQEIIKSEAVKLESLAMNIESANLCCGDSLVLIADTIPANTTDEIIWESSNVDVAVVKDGVVTALNDGQCDITVKSANGISAVCKIMVTHYERTIMDREVTCGMTGRQHKECIVCGYIGATEIVPCTGSHVLQTEVKIPATCGEDGISYKACKWCTYTEAEQVIPATGEHQIEVEVQKEPTCTETGVELHRCVVCEYENLIETKKATHIYGEGKVSKEATCKEAGIMTYCCETCGNEKEQKIQQLTNHSYERKMVLKTSSFKADGQVMHVCKECGAEKIYTILKAKKPQCETKCYTYDGVIRTPEVEVSDSNGSLLEKNADYEVTYSPGRRSVGKYYVTISLKGDYEGSEKVSFVIQPKAPKDMKTSKISTDKASVTWEKCVGAKMYAVYYKEAGTRRYTLYKMVRTPNVDFINLDDGKDYEIKVVPCYDALGSLRESTEYSNVEFSTPEAIAIKNVKKISERTVKVSWDLVKDASGYQISRSSSREETAIAATINRQNVQSVMLSTNKSGMYYYKVRYYKLIDGKKVYSEWSNIIVHNN